MRAKFLSVFSFHIHVRKMSCRRTSHQKLFKCGNFSFSSTYLDHAYFTRMISLSSTFNDVGVNTEVDSLFTDSDYKDMTQKVYRHSDIGHNLLVIQPRIKAGPKKQAKDLMELKLSEAVALVETLPDWRVMEKCVIPVPSLGSKLLFGKGNLERIQTLLQRRQDITGIFIGVDILTALQNVNLEEYFGMQIFDRYRIVLQIFHDHAHTREAKLQTALAEIPYLRVKLCGYSHTFNADFFTDIRYVGGYGETFMETRRRVLHEREMKIKKAMDKLKKQRHLLRQSETRKSYPIVAVVGYTNCGKTTLIKALTRDNRLKPENKLFATLDVTLHAGLLPSSQKVLYIDTVGFISDVPTALIEAFRATLEDVAVADVIIHVRDISHPDSATQKTVVLETLKSLHLPDTLMDSIIEIGNKVDLIDESEIKNENFIPVSATEGTNLQMLSEMIEEGIVENTGRCVKVLRIPNGGEEYRWLCREAAVRDAVADETDYNYLLVEVIISQETFAKFAHRYGDLTVHLPCTAKNL